MEISTEKSEVGPPEQGTPVAVGADGTAIFSPPIFKTTAQTVVSASSGQTVVFAGLMTKSTSETQRAVPYLSDLPLIGPAFRFTSTTDERTELLIIMTPHVINGDEDLARLKTVESERMSWALSDVIDLHGDVGLSGRGSSYGANSQIIYPDSNPTGRTGAHPATGTTDSARSGTSTWKKLFSGFSGDTEETNPVEATAGPRPEPSASRSSQSNLNQIRRTSGLQPDSRVLYTPTPQQPAAGHVPLPSQPIPPGYPESQPGNHNQLIQQPYPLGAATQQQPVPTPYTAASGSYYQPTYHTIPGSNPNLPSNGYQQPQYIPAGTTVR